MTGEALRRWREHQGLSQDAMGDLLGISREWVGKIERGERPVSAKIYLTFERVRREPRFSDTGEPEAAKSGAVEEPPASYGTPAMLRQEVRSVVEDTLRLAGDDLGRLGWTREQALRHLAAPEHWSIHEEVIRQVHQERKISGAGGSGNAKERHGA